MKGMPRQLRHRSRSEVISSILEATNGNKLRMAEIQFKTYMSYNILKEYLVHLLQCDLIDYIEGERTFKTTPKGMQVLQKYNKMEDCSLKLIRFGKSTDGKSLRSYNMNSLCAKLFCSGKHLCAEL